MIEDSYSITDNTSTVKWVLESVGGNSNYYNMYNIEAIVDGSTVYGPVTKTWSTKVFPASKGSVSGTVTITHNDDGSHGDITFTIKGRVFNSGTETHSDTLPLTTIPRASIITSTSAGYTLGSNGPTISITKYLSSFYNVLTITNDSTTITRNGFNGGKITFTDAERYSIYSNYNNNGNAKTETWNVYLTTYQDSTKTTQIGSTQSSTVNITTENKNTLTIQSTCTVESAFNISSSYQCGGSYDIYGCVGNYYGSSGASICYSLTGQTSAKSNYSITPTASTIYNSNTSSQSGTIYWTIISKVNGSEIGRNTYTQTYSFNRSLCKPSVSSFKYQFAEGDAATLMNLSTSTWYTSSDTTGLNDMIAGKSQIKFQVTGSLVTGKGNVSLSKVYVTIPGQSNKETTTNGGTLTSGVLTQSGSFYAYAVDSRGFVSDAVQISYSLRGYSSPSFNSMTIIRNPMTSGSDTDKYAKLSFSISVPSYIVSAPNTSVTKYTITYLYYDTEWHEVPFTNESALGTTISCSNQQLSTVFVTNTQYQFKVKIVDYFGSTVESQTQIIPISAPLLAKRSKRLGINTIPKHVIGNTNVALDVAGPAYIDGNGQITGYATVGSDLTVGGRVYYSVDGSQDYNEAGFRHDQYGNWYHRRNTSGDTWSIANYAGTSMFTVYPETGHAEWYCKSVYNSNANNASKTGVEYWASGNSNVPSAWTMMLNMNGGGGDAAQLGIYVSDGTLYTRGKANGNWGNWNQIAKKSEIPNLLDKVYPVGSIYMSAVNTSPASFLGGTWERLTGGLLYGAVSSYGSGNGTGTSTNSHTLTVSEMPSHGHIQSWAGNDGTTNNLVTNKTTGSHAERNTFGTGSGCRYNAQTAWHGSGATIIGTGTTGEGGGHSHNIPYISVFVWRRTA